MIATPNSAVKPTALDMFRCMPRTYRASTPPMQAKGTASSTTTAARCEPNVTHSSTKIRNDRDGDQNQEMCSRPGQVLEHPQPLDAVTRIIQR